MERIVLFGYGELCRSLYKVDFFETYDVVGIVDNDKNKWGEQTLSGKSIQSPEVLLKLEYDRVFLSIYNYKGIQKQLIEEFHISPDKITYVLDEPKEILKKEGINMLLRYHCLPNPCLPQFIVSCEETEVEEDDGLLRRIAEAYNASVKNFQIEGESWWTTGNLWENKKHIHEKLISKNWNEIKYALHNPAVSKLHWGFEGITQFQFQTDEEIEAEIRLIADMAIQLAAFLGVIRMPNPESPDLRHFSIDFDEMFDGVAKKLGIDLRFINPYPGELGIKTKRGIVNSRALQALYQAYKIRELVKGNTEARVLEIGAGLGRTAYFAYQMGIKNYTIIDIPMTNVAQAHFLGKTLGEENITLLGEDNIQNVRILPTYMLDKETQDFDIIVNVDSMTEMDEKSQRDYWEYIKNHTDIFLSINHEFNKHTVSEYYKITDCEVRRHLYPMRRGYLEEEIYFEKYM